MRIGAEMFSILSRFLNVLSGGTADMTLSARSHRDGLKIEKAIDWVFWTLFREKNHCEVWWKHEVLRSRATVEWQQRAKNCPTCNKIEDSNYV